MGDVIGVAVDGSAVRRKGLDRERRASANRIRAGLVGVVGLLLWMWSTSDRAAGAAVARATACGSPWC